MCFLVWVQDAQFSIGQSSKFSAALWYPGEGNPWHGEAHYTVSCDWVAMDVVRGYSTHKEVGSWDGASAFAFVISVVALAVSIFVGYLLVSKSKSIDFTPIDRLWILSFHFVFCTLDCLSSFILDPPFLFSLSHHIFTHKHIYIYETMKVCNSHLFVRRNFGCSSRCVLFHRIVNISNLWRYENGS